MGIRMIATKDMTYATRRLKAGDEIENVNGPNARLLAALGRAETATDEPAHEPTPPVSEPDGKDEQPKPKKQATRRKRRTAND